MQQGHTRALCSTQTPVEGLWSRFGGRKAPERNDAFPVEVLQALRYAGCVSPKRRRFKPGHPTPFERRCCQLIDYIRQTRDLSPLEAMYLEASSEYERAHVCMQMAIQSAIRLLDGEAAYRWLRLARQHAIDDFSTLSVLLLDEAIIHHILSDPTEIERMGL